MVHFYSLHQKQKDAKLNQIMILVNQNRINTTFRAEKANNVTDSAVHHSLSTNQVREFNKFYQIPNPLKQRLEEYFQVIH